MAMEPKIIADFPKCPHCGSEEKVSEMGCAPSKISGKIPKDAFTSLRQEVTPIEQPVMAGVMVPAIVNFYDNCGTCGTPRCTRAQLIMAPVMMQGVPGNGPGGMQGFRSKGN